MRFPTALVTTRGNPADAFQVPADYNELGILLITATVLGFVLPMLAILFVKSTRFAARSRRRINEGGGPL